MEKELRLTDLIQMEILENLQEVLAEATGFSGMVTDERGEILTAGSNLSYFCSKYMRKTSAGRHRCAQCYCAAVQKAMDSGMPEVCLCHAGLINVVSPIALHGKLIGMLVGCCVQPENISPQEQQSYAEACGMSLLEYRTAIRGMKTVGSEQIEQATRMAFLLSGTLTNIAYNQELIFQNKKNLESVMRTRSDYFANMNHELRTPLNAIIGMTEIALREEISERVHYSLSQIEASGHNLLSIINDILDFSKIDSGSMEIENVDYRMTSILQDVTGITAVNGRKKRLEFTVDVQPDMPDGLTGDPMRVKQIMLNVLSNAVKFTQSGMVHLKIEYEVAGEKEIEVMISVADTGIGIKKGDVEKLFHSFQQLDSKRNRNVEGTGLGLAITKSLLTLMGGSIYVESEQGKGSTFYMAFPQKVWDQKPMAVKQQNDIGCVAVRISNVFLEKQLKVDLKRFGIGYRTIIDEGEISQAYESGIHKLIIEQSLFPTGIQRFVEDHPDMQCVVLTECDARFHCEAPNIRVVQKPVYSVNLIRILEDREEPENDPDSESKWQNFAAPEASVLVVDDNEVNLTVAVGLLKPLKMRVDTAISGFKALERIGEHKYDLVFMDHMMPEMDGIETTHKIRQQYPQYAQMPIVALTANAMEGTREMFLKEGMSDFQAKPVNFKDLARKVLKWLPKELVIKSEGVETESDAGNLAETLHIEGINVQAAMDLVGTEELFWSVLQEYYKSIRRKSNVIEEHYNREDWFNYTIEVHALKSAARQVGALGLGELAASLEQAGKDDNIGLIRENNHKLLSMYRGYEPVLEPYFKVEESQEGKEPLPLEAKHQLFQEMLIACDELDMDGMEDVIAKMKEYRYEGAAKESFEKLKDAVEELDTEKIQQVIDEWPQGVSYESD